MSEIAVDRVRDDFPILSQTVVEDTDLIYLDNAATTHTPEPVISTMADFQREDYANVHRGLHHLSQRASDAYEAAHDRVADFIGADHSEEIIFTKNTTESINLVAQAWGLRELGPGDTIVTTEMEHHASLVTWQQICQRTGASIEYIPVTEDGTLDMEAAKDLITDDTALVSVVHVSNVLGTVNPVEDLADIAHDHDALLFVDGAQAVPNRPVDVESLGVDFYAFSGHKMCGPTGIGVLYGRRQLLEEMEPFIYGGGMIHSVTKEQSSWNDLPWKFEAGTPVIVQGVGLAAACDYLDDIGRDRICNHEEEIVEYALDRLSEREHVTVYGPQTPEKRCGLVSFTVEDIHPHDMGSILKSDGIAVRGGDHCTQPLHTAMGVPATTRASFYVYNDREEVDALLQGIDKAVDIFDL